MCIGTLAKLRHFRAHFKLFWFWGICKKILTFYLALFCWFFGCHTCPFIFVNMVGFLIYFAVVTELYKNMILFRASCYFSLDSPSCCWTIQVAEISTEHMPSLMKRSWQPRPSKYLYSHFKWAGLRTHFNASKNNKFQFRHFSLAHHDSLTTIHYYSLIWSCSDKQMKNLELFILIQGLHLGTCEHKVHCLIARRLLCRGTKLSYS